ncbi:hypothetical protein ACFQ08_30165, partial [Streptosporangium algeriense]
MNVLAVGHEVVAAAPPWGWHAPWWPVFPVFWVLVWAGVATLAVRAVQAGADLLLMPPNYSAAYDG